MPLLQDVVSRFTMSPELKSQESYKTTILKWMQKNPHQLRNTNLTKLARTIKLGEVTPQSEDQILYTLYNLTHDGLLVYNGKKKAGRKKKTFFINYFHENLPPAIRENITDSDRARVKKTLGLVYPEYVSGKKEEQEPVEHTRKVAKKVQKKTAKKVVRIEPKAEAKEEPKAEEPKVEEPKVEEPKAEEPKVEEPKAEEPKVEPIIESATEPATESATEPVVESVIEQTTPMVEVSTPTANSPVEIRQNPDGSFSLNLNLNITINTGR